MERQKGMQPQQILTIILLALVFLVASVLLAALYNSLAVGVLNFPFTTLGAFLIFLSEAMEKVRDFIEEKRQSLLHFLADKTTGDTGVGEILGPLIYLVFFVVLAIGDLYVAVIVVPLLLGAEPPQDLNPELIPFASAMLYFVMFVAIFAVAADIFGMTRFAHVYQHGDTNPALQRVLKYAALAVIGLLLIFAALLGVFRGQLATGTLVQNNPFLAALFFVLLVLASVATGLMLIHGFAAILLILAFFIDAVARAMPFFLEKGAFMLDKLATLLLFIYTALAELGKIVWNWLSRVTNGKVGPIPAYKARPTAFRLAEEWAARAPQVDPAGAKANIP